MIGKLPYAKAYKNPVIILASLTILIVFFSPLGQSVANTYEHVSFFIAPSDYKAYSYGERHFRAQNPSQYDIGRAEWYFQKALEINPSLPYIHHELARIAFLKGNFVDALRRINIQIAMQGDATPNSYYVRGLIEGYMGAYDSAAEDYEHFLTFRPHNWAAVNDYAWVLLKDDRPHEAVKAVEEVLPYFPENPWLLNSSAIALYEIGDFQKAYERVQKAWEYVQKVQESEWLRSYPGNDPAIAEQGIATFRTAVAENMHKVELALASSTVQ